MPNIKNILRKSSKKEKVNYTHIYDEDYFLKIDSELKAYWLGFIMADGCIKTSNKRSYGLFFSLAEEDGDMVLKFRDEIAPLKDVSIENPGKNNVQRSVKLSIFSNKICFDLFNLNCITNKSLVLKFPPNNSIPDIFIKDFVRGYFDGDGGFIRSGSNLYMKIISSHLFCKKMAQILSKNGISNKISKVNYNKNSIVKICNGIDLSKFYKYIYNNATIFLKRKRDIFDSWIKKKKEILFTNKAFRPSLKERNNKFISRISINGKWIYIGSFLSKGDAIKTSYDKWVKLKLLYLTKNQKQILLMEKIISL